jgi:hypothetical protein
MPESSLQDLRDDWSVGDPVLVEFRGFGGTTTSLRAGRITNKEAAFATVRIEHNGKLQKFPYKQLRQPSRPARPSSQPPQQMLLRSVPPAFTKMVEATTEPPPAPVAAPPATVEPPLVQLPRAAAKPAPASEQVLVKLEPKATPVHVAKPVAEKPAPAPAPKPATESQVIDMNTWLKMGQSVLAVLAQSQKEKQAEHDALMAQAKKLADEAATRAFELQAIQTQIDTFRRLREFVSRVRPKVEFNPIGSFRP